MGIRYYKLFDMLNRKGYKKSDLRQILSSATIAKLSKGQHISGEAIEKICEFLNCQPGDIMEYVQEATNNITNTNATIAIYTDDDDEPIDVIDYTEKDKLNNLS